MYTKSLFLVLLGCTLIMASPVHDSQAHRTDRSILGTFAEWLHKADEGVDKVYETVKKPFVKVFNALVETGEGVVDYSKEKVQAVLEKYYELKSKSEEKVNQAKNAFLSQLVDQMQKVVDTLNQQSEDNLDKLKEKTQEIAQKSKEALEKLQKQLQEAIDAEKEKLNQDLSNWEQEANEVVNEDN